MRIGTWNLAGRWTPRQADFLAALDCDVLVTSAVRVPAMHPDGRLSDHDAYVVTLG